MFSFPRARQWQRCLHPRRIAGVREQERGAGCALIEFLVAFGSVRASGGARDPALFSPLGQPLHDGEQEKYGRGLGRPSRGGQRQLRRVCENHGRWGGNYGVSGVNSGVRGSNCGLRGFHHGLRGFHHGGAEVEAESGRLGGNIDGGDSPLRMRLHAGAGQDSIEPGRNRNGRRKASRWR